MTLNYRITHVHQFRSIQQAGDGQKWTKATLIQFKTSKKGQEAPMIVARSLSGQQLPQVKWTVRHIRLDTTRPRHDIAAAARRKSMNRPQASVQSADELRRRGMESRVSDGPSGDKKLWAVFKLGPP